LKVEELKEGTRILVMGYDGGMVEAGNWNVGEEVEG
jgi:hypothetical protein